MSLQTLCSLQLTLIKNCLQDRHAWPGADGRSREDHDAERRDVWHLHGHRYGHPLLRRTGSDFLHHLHLHLLNTTTVQLWDSSNNYDHSSVSARCYDRSPICLDLSIKVQLCQTWFRVDVLHFVMLLTSSSKWRIQNGKSYLEEGKFKLFLCSVLCSVHQTEALCSGSEGLTEKAKV